MNRARVFCQPGFARHELLRLTARKVPSQFTGRPVSYCFRGSSAIGAAMKLLKLGPGDAVLFPAYHCGIELDVLVKHGISVRFYDVDDRLRVDFQHLRSLVDRHTRLLYLIHYFGFSGPLMEASRFCAEHHLVLFEDCAQALYSAHEENQLGTSGQLAIFSLRKTLGIPCGGALVVNDRSLPLPKMVRTPPVSETLKKAIRLVVQDLAAGAFAKTLPKRLTNRLEGSLTLDDGVASRTQIPSPSVPPPIEFKSCWDGLAISPLSRWLFTRTRHEEIIRRRRANYRFLLGAVERCQSFVPLIRELPSGICPLLFPLLVRGPRQPFVRFLRTRGILGDPHWPYYHPAFPASEFPGAVRLKEQLVVLPVHQDLTARALTDIVETLEKWEFEEACRLNADEESLQPAPAGS
jgi:perosamine synthetase